GLGGGRVGFLGRQALARRAAHLRRDVRGPSRYRPRRRVASRADGQRADHHAKQHKHRQPALHRARFAWASSFSKPTDVTPPTMRVSTTPSGSSRNDSGTPRTPQSTLAPSSSTTGQSPPFDAKNERTSDGSS